MGGTVSVLAALAGRLIVSCQAYPGEPMRHPDTMRRVAQAAVAGGAAGIRAQGLADLEAIRAAVEVPLIGLWKDGDEPVFITPTVEHARAVALTGADIVAVDGTRRTRPDGSPLAASIEAVHDLGALVMADCSSVDDALEAEAGGADIVGTTLAGYTQGATHASGPDLAVLAAMASAVSVPVLCEGRVRSPDDARAALGAGAFAVVVGTAITHPTSITRSFVDAITDRLPPR